MRDHPLKQLWDRLPLPWQPVGGLALGAFLQRTTPIWLPRWLRVPGALLALTGATCVGLATRERGPGSLDEPLELVTSGTHGWSRNPMYVGWAAVHIGLALATRNAWTAATWPVFCVDIHRWVLREEAWLTERFGAQYVDYQARVPRYLGRRQPHDSGSVFGR
jgi:protein-S-isoprenylcysteine O-methyltransferase Ste14